MDWSSATIGGAFVAGAVLATFAVLRIVRAVTTFYDGIDAGRHRRRLPRPDDDDADE